MYSRKGVDKVAATGFILEKQLVLLSRKTSGEVEFYTNSINTTIVTLRLQPSH